MGARIHNTFNSSTGLDLSYYLNEVSTNKFVLQQSLRVNTMDSIHYYCPSYLINAHHAQGYCCPVSCGTISQCTAFTSECFLELKSRAGFDTA